MPSIATGYYRLGIWDDEPSDPLQALYDGLDDIVATTGQVFLGLTIDCARCHNHKIDPIPQKDYYRLLAFFQNINPGSGGPGDQRPILTPENQRAYEERVKALEERRNHVQAEISALEAEFVRAYEKGDKATLVSGDLDDLSYKFYRDSWTRLPDFSALKHEEEGKLPRNLFDLSPRTRNEAFGFVFEGTLIVPQAGTYTFFLDSDDGSRLTVAGKQVIEYDGIHELGKEKSATSTLSPGRLPIKLEYFQSISGLGLKVAWSGPGIDRRSLSAATKQGGRFPWPDRARRSAPSRQGAHGGIQEVEKDTGILESTRRRRRHGFMRHGGRAQSARDAGLASRQSPTCRAKR